MWGHERVLVLWLGLLAVVSSSPTRSRRQAIQEPFTLEEVAPSQYGQTGFTGTWISDSEFTYTIAGEAGIQVFDVSTLISSVLVSGELLAFLNTSSPRLTGDREYILAPSEVQPVYRYSTTARYSLYEIATNTVSYIAGQARLQLCVLDGVGHGLAYVLDNNVYYLPEGATQAIQLTFDGVPGVIYNGHTDWVYEEDVFYSGQALWFSTDGSRLAVASFNDTLVEAYSYYYFADIADPDDAYPELVDLKYPKVGTTNPTVTLRVIDLNNLVATGVVTWITLEAPADVTEDHILGGVTWPTATEVAANWLNRRQNLSMLRICDVVTGTCQEEVRTQPNGWVYLALPRFNSGGDLYVSLRWSQQQVAGEYWQQLYLSTRVGGVIASESITPGAFTVDTFVGMDETNVAYYYTRTVEGAPWQRHVHVAGARAGCLSCGVSLPGGGTCTYASATASTRARYLSLTCQTIDEPAVVYLIDPLTNTILYTWADNAELRQRLESKILHPSFITTVPLEDGRLAPVRFHLPPELDLNGDTKYPLIFYVYSGPNTNTVYDTFSVGYQNYLTTNRSIIYMLADGRGSGLKGQEMVYSLNNALGSVEMDDHLVILREVMGRYPWIDETRVGMWGASYGGYATLLTMIKDDEDLIRCGVSSAPVTSWLYYNTMYTERYMGLPTPEDNLAGYENGDVTLLAERLRGKDFYIMHGNADDNVHYQNAAKLYKRLAELDIPFQQMSYPDEAHSLAGVPRHRYNTMDRYWTQCLDLQT